MACPDAEPPGGWDAPGWDAAWRVSELEQLVLDDARVLWQRFVDETRRDAALRRKQLSILAKLSAIVAGFSMSSFLEFNFTPAVASDGVLLAYGLTTTLVAAIYMCCLAACNLMQGAVLRVSSTYISEAEEGRHILQCREFAIRYRKGDAPPAPARSFRRWWEVRCGPRWRVTLLLFAAGVPLFLANMAVSAWIKFTGYSAPAALMTAIMGGSLAYLTATGLRWISHLVESQRASSQTAHLEAEPLRLPWDWHSQAVPYPNGVPFTGPAVPLPATGPSTPGKPAEDDPAERLLRARRAEDAEQQHLDNAMQLWDRFERGLKVEIRERAEQLRDTSFLAGIMLSFGMAALYQLDFDETRYPGVLDCCYAATVALTASLNLCTLTICGFLNMGIVKAGAALASAEERSLFLARAAVFARHGRPGERPPRPPRSLAKYWAAKCERNWLTAFGAFLTGALVFQLCLICAAWLKFLPRSAPGDAPDSSRWQPAAAMSAVQGAGVLYFAYTCLRWSGSGHAACQQDDWLLASQLPSVGLPFDWHLPPAARPAGQPPGLLGPAVGPFRPSPESPYALLQPHSAASSCDGSSERQDAWQDGGLWAEQLVERRHLRNARALWGRFVAAHTNDLEERSEQLTAVMDLAAIISGFEMIAFLQFSFDVTAVNRGLQLAYVATSGLTVALMATAMTLCGVMLESVLESSPGFVSGAQEADFLAQCHRFCHQYQPGDVPPAPRRSFSSHWDAWCRGEWTRAFTLFSLGVPLFLANAAITAWIKFEGQAFSGIGVAVLQALAVLYLLLSHVRWASHIVSDRPSQQAPKARLAPAGLPFDWHLPPRKQAGGRTASGRRRSSGGAVASLP